MSELWARRQALAAGEWQASQLCDGVYLGNGYDAQNASGCRNRGITHILNVADDVPNYHEGQFTYLRLDVTDCGGDAGASRTFADASRFVKSALDRGGRILIHCAHGANRSATVAIAVLMDDFGMSLAQAWAVVRSRRVETSPLKDNRLELLAYEQATQGAVTMRESDSGGCLRALPPAGECDASLPSVGTRVRIRGRDVGGLVWAVTMVEGTAHVDILLDVLAGRSETCVITVFADHVDLFGQAAQLQEDAAEVARMART